MEEFNYYCYQKGSETQKYLCEKVSPQLGSLGAFAIAPLDIAIDVLKRPLSACEKAANVVISLCNLNLRRVIMNVEGCLSELAVTPIAVASIPFKLTFQFLSIFFDPEGAQSFNEFNNGKLHPDKCYDLQVDLKDHVGHLAKHYPIRARAASLAAAVTYVALDILRSIEWTLFEIHEIAVRLLSPLLFETPDIRDILKYSEFALNSIAHLGVTLLMAPIKLPYVAVAIVVDPSGDFRV